jgi:hypothetical protein
VKKEAKNPLNGLYPKFTGVNVTVWRAKIRGA